MGRGPPWVPTVPSQRLVLEMRLNDDDATAPIHLPLADEFPPAAERSCSQHGYGIFWRQVFEGSGPLPSIPTLPVPVQPGPQENSTI